MKKILSTIVALFLLPITAFAAPAFTVSQGGTGTGTPWSKYPLTGNGSSALAASSTPWLVGINATSTSQDSTFVRLASIFSTSTNGTTTNFFSTTASTTNFWGGGLPGAGCTGSSSFLQWIGGLFSCGTPAGSTGVWSTTSADYYHSQFSEWSVQGNGYLAPTTTRGIIVSALPSASSTLPNLSVTNGTTTNATTTNMNVQNFTATGSSTLQNFVGLNSTSTNATTTNAFSTTASSTNLYSSNEGIASSSPFYSLSVGQGTGSSSASILVAENQEATSSTMTISWKTGNSSLVRIGNGAITISFSNQTDGGQKTVTVCNPKAGTAGAITWSGVLWPAGTVPTQTTSVNHCDVWSFKATSGTSSLVVFGAQTANF